VVLHFALDSVRACVGFQFYCMSIGWLGNDIMIYDGWMVGMLERYHLERLSGSGLARERTCYVHGSGSK